ncbi:MAG: N-carbamoylputrescine amidase [Gammaproteobacteria bacterium]
MEKALESNRTYFQEGLDMKTKNLRIGIGQIDCSVATVDDNLDKHLEVIERARGDKVDLLVFPELSLTGYPQTTAEIEVLACSSGSGPLARLAKATDNMIVVVGFIEEAPDAQFYNSCAVLSNGEIIHLHRKLNLATYGALHEGKLYGAGRYVETFTFGPWRACVLICADVWNPALVTLAALHGATVLIIPTNSARGAVSNEFSSPHGWDTATRFYSMMYGMTVVMSNRIGNESGLEFWGGSNITDPFGKTIACADSSEELLIADIEYDSIRRARLQLPTVRDSNLALIGREIQRLQQRLGIPDVIRQIPP